MISLRFLALAIFLAAGCSLGLAQEYKGLIAPKNKTVEQKKEQPGYQGLIPGRIEEKKAEPPAEVPSPQITEGPVPENTELEEATFTPVPGYSDPPPPVTADDLALAATIEGIKIDVNNPPEDFTSVMIMPEGTKDILSKPRPRIDGMLPAEFAAKKTIDDAFAQINEAGLSPAEQKKRIQAAYAALVQMEEGVLSQKSVPDSTYKIMKAPDIYIQETKEGNEKALNRLGTAIKTLKKMM